MPVLGLHSDAGGLEPGGELLRDVAGDGQGGTRVGGRAKNEVPKAEGRAAGAAVATGGLWPTRIGPSSEPHERQQLCGYEEAENSRAGNGEGADHGIHENRWQRAGAVKEPGGCGHRGRWCGVCSAISAYRSKRGARW